MRSQWVQKSQFTYQLPLLRGKPRAPIQNESYNTFFVSKFVDKKDIATQTYDRELKFWTKFCN